MDWSHTKRRLPSENYHTGKNGKQERRGRPQRMLLDWMMMTDGCRKLNLRMKPTVDRSVDSGLDVTTCLRAENLKKRKITFNNESILIFSKISIF